MKLKGLESESSEKWVNSVFVMIPLWIGMNSINEELFEPILEMFEQECGVGIIGGWPKYGLYFIGC